jgi:glycosyltransferase involved in cell wall biosynthesis
MKQPKVSIVIPAFNQSNYIEQAIQSVLAQSYPDWELIVVDDGSTDDTAARIASFTDPRIRYIHQQNKGLPGARNTGIAQATGEYIAFLDADDAYHPEKLVLHIAHLDQNPTVGLSYSARVHIDQHGAPFWIYRSSDQVGLSDLVLDFPFTINDFLIRRPLVKAVGGFDESYRLHGEDRDFYLRLALAGCHFRGVNRALAYRRLHAYRVFTRIPERIDIMLRALETAFRNPRCPASVVELRKEASSKIYLYWAYQELAQEITALGQQHLRQALRLKPSSPDEKIASLSRYLAWASVSNNEDHEQRLRVVLAQLPPELERITANADQIVAQGYLIRGMREIIWGRLTQARPHLRCAARLGGEITPIWINMCADQVTAYEVEFGAEATDLVLHNLVAEIPQTRGNLLRQLQSKYAMNRAFKLYRSGAYAQARSNAWRAIVHDPGLIANRGTLSVLLRSFLMPGKKQLSTT